MSGAASRIAAHLRRGFRVAVADGCGAPVGLSTALSEAAADIGGVRLLLGWCFDPPVDLDDIVAFSDIRTIMGGYALRHAIEQGRVRYLPVRYGAVPALLAGPLRPDVVVVSLRPGRTGFVLGSEAGWMPAAIENGATVLAEVNHGLPAASGEPELPRDQVVVVAETDRPAHEVTPVELTERDRVIGEGVAAVVAEGSAVQFGPGRIAEAALAALGVPVHVDSGVLIDGVVDLDERGLLRGTPSANYLIGSARLHAWADGRGAVRRTEHTHDITRLSERPFVAINTALEIDRVGAVNVERADGKAVSGIGGHGDFAAAAARAPRGVSVLALPTDRGGRPTLVEQLSAPVSTGYADVDVVVTELGTADLRGLDPSERAVAIASLWPDGG